MAIFVSEEAREEFLDYVEDEVRLAIGENDEQRGTWKKWRRQREARPESKVKNWPWPEASNVSVPLSNITSQTMVGQLMGALAFVDPFLAAVPMNKHDPAEVRRTKSLTKYLSILAKSPYEIDLEKQNRTILYETGTMGTNWVDVVWDDSPWSFVKADGEVVTNAKLHYGVSWVPVALEDVLHRQDIQNPDEMPWIARRMILPLWKVEDLVQSGDFLDPEGKVVDYDSEIEGSEKEARRDQQTRQGIMPLHDTSAREVYKVFARWDANEDGMSEEIIVLVHLPTRTVLLETFNSLGMRTLRPSNYIERPFFVEGIGVCWLTEHMQDEVDTTHNLRINSMHLATMPIFAAKGNSRLNGEVFRPGKIIQLDDPNSIKQLTTNVALQWSERSEMLAGDYAKRAAGASDPMAGFGDMTARSGETLGGQTQKLQQGTKMVHSVIQALKGFYRTVGMLTVMHLIDHKEDVLARERIIMRMEPGEIKDLEAVFSIKVEELPQRLTFQVRAADTDQTLQEKRQDLLFRIQIMNMFYDRLTPIAIQLSNPQLPPEAKVFLTQVYTATCRTMEQVLEFFDESEPDKFVPEYRKLEMFNEFLQVMYDARFEQMLQKMTGGAYVPRERPVGPAQGRAIPAPAQPGGAGPAGMASPAGEPEGAGAGVPQEPGMAGAPGAGLG